MSISGLDTFDLYQQMIQEILRAEDRRSINSSTGGMFLFISHWGFTFIAFYDGCPRFVRTKAINIRLETNEDSWVSTPSPSPQHPDSPQSLRPTFEQTDKFSDSSNGTNAGSPYPSYTVTKVEKEVLATFQYYLETFFHDEVQAFPSNLFVVSDLEFGHTLLPSSEHIQQTARASGLPGSQIQVNQLPSTALFNSRETRSIHKSYLWSALPGYASVKGA